MPHNFPPESQTLFYEGITGAALLVTKQKGRRRSRALRFADPHAALSWCIERSASFVFTPSPPVNRN